ncbi:pseudoazurin [Chelativorans sp. AA-79]|uniref:pseudoazurin n=1 Tax=Chelativorans sp. AA-79 TaxID=3028735 RepID=UPI0023F63051|nr:pseudoazurin [Chelativorans sp. AA-79]WEX08610.1 pseudoazurin [Chelativorans sp. AA-79]
MRYLSVLAAGAMAIVALNGVQAAEVEVKMLNRGEKGVMVFEPDLITIQPGDSVRFVATDKGHNVESIKEMLPAGAEAFTGKMNKELTVTFEQPGAYGVKCKPHYGMGMVALVVVGEPENRNEVAEVKHPGKAGKVFTTLFEELDKVQSAAR